MKTDKQKRIEYLESQIQTMQDTVERLKKEEDAERSEFDFRIKMPVGSVWLGAWQVTGHNGEYGADYIRILPLSSKDVDKIHYHAHQIVKMARGWYSHEEKSVPKLMKALEAAERDGVLQNLE